MFICLLNLRSCRKMIMMNFYLFILILVIYCRLLLILLKLRKSMQIMIEVFDFASDASHKSCYRNTVSLDGDSFPYDDFKRVFSILYPYKYITFTIVPDVKPMKIK